uniref:Uncharacterized protein n=1 Tax=Rhizophora mucronata TaxID=61149 RepID=A0A2P2N4I5_RHIMU
MSFQAPQLEERKIPFRLPQLINSSCAKLQKKRFYIVICNCQVFQDLLEKILRSIRNYK